MQENELIIKTLYTNLTHLLKNQELSDKITSLINIFDIEKSSVNIIKQNDGRIYNLLNDNNILQIIFLNGLNDIEINYKSNNIIKEMKIKIRKDEINIYEKEEYKENNKDITKTTNKVYLNDYLVKAMYCEFIKDETKIFKCDELLGIKDGFGFLKKQTKINDKLDTEYFKINNFKNNMFDNKNIENNINYEVSNINEYNDFLKKYEVSLLSIRFVDILYVTDGYNSHIEGVLLSSNSKSIELLTDDRQIEIPYDRILKITYNNRKIYSNNKRKKLTL